MSISPKLVKELGVKKNDIVSGLRSKITGLKHKYWKSLFDHLKEVTRRLATKQRKQFLESVREQRSIDFTRGNIHSVMIWITKSAGDHFDDQLVEMFKSLAQVSNVEAYKSNERVFKKGDWRYLKDEASHLKLCYRLVLERWSAIYTGNWERESFNGLTEDAHNYIMDIITVANNLGFDCDDTPLNYEWQSNKKIEIVLRDGSALMDIRAFKNGNLHIRFNKKAMLAINVQAGKLLGWLRNWEEAVEELQVDEAEKSDVEKVFGISYQVLPKNLRITQGVAV